MLFRYFNGSGSNYNLMIYINEQITITKLFIVTTTGNILKFLKEYRVSTTKRIQTTHLTPYRFILIIHYQFQISLRSSCASAELHSEGFK
jgi:hypothetical protein